MSQKLICELKKGAPFLLDGASGTALQEKGLCGCPESWALENPGALIELQRAYVRAGSRAISAFTFGATRTKLAEYGLADSFFDMNVRLAQLSREAAGNDAFVGGDLGPCGKFARPLGDMTFEDMVSAFREQARALIQGGVDYFTIETMIDIQEARAALIAVREECSLPVFVSMTYDESGRTLTGTDPVTALITLQSLGADAVGCNCSSGPQEMISIIEKMRPFARVPLLAKPNAGLPVFSGGKTTFDVSPQEFAAQGRLLCGAGAGILGGCCGTTPAHIAALSASLEGVTPPVPVESGISAITGARSVHFFGRGLTVIGERINPTGKKDLQAALLSGDMGYVLRLAESQVESGAQALDINVGMPGAQEESLLPAAVEAVSSRVDAPLCIDTVNPAALEAALRIYPGRALINSVSAESGKMERTLAIAKKYGAMLIALPIGEKVPKTAAGRAELAERIITAAAEQGIAGEDIAVDGLALSVSSETGAAKETLETIRYFAQKGFNTVCGLSNVSFGLPKREWINAAFLAAAVQHGLSAAIMNPGVESAIFTGLAADLLHGNDDKAARYIAAAAGSRAQAPPDGVRAAVLGGDHERMPALIEKALAETDAKTVLEGDVLPALEEAGRRFEEKKCFLPQLIASAKAAGEAFRLLEPRLTGDNGAKKRGRVVLATVRGDIHDIGKNIVGLMLKNHGFEVFDLGCDVPAEEIVAKARETGAELVALSALITTTMTQMPVVIGALREAGLACRVIVGGAVITQSYADAIGADGYGRDAMEAVRLAKSLTGEEK